MATRRTAAAAVVRAEVVLAARARLAGGLYPSADDLAEMLLDEIVGGRLH